MDFLETHPQEPHCRHLTIRAQREEDLLIRQAPVSADIERVEVIMFERHMERAPAQGELSVFERHLSHSVRRLRVRASVSGQLARWLGVLPPTALMRLLTSTFPPIFRCGLA